ncbi:MAG TPA: M28 family peptidase [Candidatus Thermoplasmatota archaeon]|nr:M28 family peptidase [Candidatus Thermoplasmatota archaeon]
MAARALLPVAVLLLGAFAGCLEEAQIKDAAEDVVSGPEAQLLALLGSVAEPQFDSMKAVGWWEKFVKDNDMRQFPLPKNHMAAMAIESELMSAGFQARTIYNFGGAGPVPAQSQSAAPAGFRVVQGIKEGTGAKDHRLVLISHFDTVPTTPQGAYDDASGVAAQMEICKLLAKAKTNKTIECVFFDNEENGLLASQAYTNWYASTKPQWVWDQAFGYDMTGLNWPGYSKWKLFSMIGKPSAEPEPFLESHNVFLDILAYNFLGAKLNVTTDGVEILKVHDRNSDEQNFKRVGIPVIRFAGGRKAADYPQYHKQEDTVEFVYRFACECQDLAKGKESFAKGFEMVVLMSYYTILAYDQYNPKALPF